MRSPHRKRVEAERTFCGLEGDQFFDFVQPCFMDGAL